MIIISERGVKGKSNKQTKARQNSKGAGVMHKSSEQGVTQSHRSPLMEAGTHVGDQFLWTRYNQIISLDIRLGIN